MVPTGSPKEGSATRSGALLLSRGTCMRSRVASSWQISDGESLDEVATLTIEQGFEGDEIELAVGGSHHALVIGDQRLQGLEHLSGDGLCQLLYVTSTRVAQGCTQPPDCGINSFRVSQVNSFRSCITVQDVSGIAEVPIQLFGCGPEIEWR